MFYTNLLNLKDITYKTINYSSFLSGVNTVYDESILPSGYTRLSYNFDYTDGALKDGMGISTPKVRYSKDIPSYLKALNIPSDLSVEGVWLFPYREEDTNSECPLLVMYCRNGKFYYNYLQNSSTTWNEIDGLSSYYKPLVINYNLNGVDTLLIFSETEGLYTWSLNQGVKKIDGVPCMSSMCLHYERLFVTSNENDRRVWFSDDLNPTNFNISLDEGGFVDMVDNFGRSNKVVSFDGYVYDFRDYNIARITAYAEQESFNVIQLYVGSGRIFKNTVTLCGNRIMYLASDGLYSFDGSSSTKINLGINNIFDGNNENAVAGFCNGCLYLACRLKFDDDKENSKLDSDENNALIKYDISAGRVTILRGCDIRDIAIINDFLDTYIFVVARIDGEQKLGMVDNSGKIFDKVTEKIWFTPESDFDYPNKSKLVKEMYLETKSDLVVEIKVDGKSRRFKVKGRTGVSVLKPRLRGKKFSIGFLSDSVDTRVTGVQLKVGIL